jgi:N-glycosylase/DNA lyase
MGPNDGDRETCYGCRELKQQLAESESVRRSIEKNYTRLQKAVSQLPESVQDDIADKLADLNSNYN